MKKCAQVIVRCLAVAGLTWTCAHATWAARHVVLIGVTEYPSASGAKPLPGSANDVQLLHDTLVRHGFKTSEITLLSDGIAGATSPTRNNILGTLRRLIVAAQPGDFLFLHLSGHGSQQPVDPGRKSLRAEPDGLNETFLPIDIGRWDGSRSTVTNAILDVELDEILQRLLDKGIFVSASFDACHSASLMRGGVEEEVTLRHVSPASLGVPQALIDQAAERTTVSRGSEREVALDATAMPGTDRGGFVAFYAAHTTEQTPEMTMPQDRPPTGTRRKRYGVFSYTLAEALNTQTNATYRELMQFVLSRYGSQNLASKPTPVMSGTHPDAVVLGDHAQSTGPRQWPIQHTEGVWRIAAGQLPQIQEGARFALVPDALSLSEKSLATLVARRVSPFTTDLEVVRDSTQDTTTTLPPGAHARLLQPALNATLRVAEPSMSGSATLPKVLTEALQLLRKEAGLTRHIWVGVGAAADVRLHVEDQKLWLLPASGAFAKSGSGKTPSIALNHAAVKLAGLLGESLQRIGKALALMRIAEQLPREKNSALQVELMRLPEDAVAASRPLNIASVEKLHDGTKIGFVITNRARVPFDVTLLYLDSAFGITPLFPGAGEDNRVMPGSILSAGPNTIEPIVINADTVGVERLLVIATAVGAQGERNDYSYLAQPRLESTRGARQTPTLLDELLEEAVFGIPASRGASRAPNTQALLQVFAWEVVK